MAPGETDNLAEMENLDEPTLLNELKVRYKRDQIYTYVGEILVAVNPFKMIKGIYDQDKMQLYTFCPDRSTVPPHVFASADAAFSAMVQNPPGVKANQVCVISGESGAGKTESAKLFIKQIIRLSSMGSGDDQPKKTGGSLEDKIVQLNPLLESYGNAQTLRNDNSSRFGKFIELRFDEKHTIQGAYTSEYLLEKSRVVSQNDGERNFHVFYLFFAALTSDQKEKYQVGDPADHRIINGNPQAISDISGAKYKEMAKELNECIAAVGFTESEIDQLNCINAAILHLCDLTYTGDEEAKMENPGGSLAKVCNQLGLDPEQMQQAFTSSLSVTRGETIIRPYKPHEADDVRDATAKGLYGRTFTWIVSRVNALLGPKTKSLGPKDKKIGILDIFGFESFQINSFEQLLINLANEQLQFFFNNHIFKMELDEMAKEGVDGSQINYEDNQALLDMILGKNPLGLLAICDEEALFPKGTDKSMCEKLNANLGKYPKYEKPRGNEEIFSIHHYAGKVTYTAAGFLDKNRDTLPLDVVACMLDADKDLIVTVFDNDDPEDPKEKAKNRLKAKKEAKKSLRKKVVGMAKAKEKGKKGTVGSQFKSSLAELMSEMSVAAPHFVRTIKPNEQKVPNTFDDELVTKQLKYCGMLETTRIRREGYAYRPTFPDFVARYKIIGYKFTSNPPPTEATCRKICEMSGVKGFQVGKTKVFLRYFHVDELNLKLKPFPDAAKQLQRLGRGFVARRRLVKLKAAADKYKKLFEPFFTKLERAGPGFSAVLDKINSEDTARGADYWDKKEKEEVQAKIAKKFVKKVPKGGDAAAMQRAASVRWYKEIEMKKGAGVAADSGSGFHEWFHGVLSRKQSEALLSEREPGTFLVRVSESRFGYSLSHVVGIGKIKHYMIEQNASAEYQVVGNPKAFRSLNELVQYYSQHRIVSSDPVTLLFPCGQDEEGEGDLTEFMDKKKKKK